MKLHDSVERILRQKGSEVFSISPDATVYEALETLEEKNVGALLVMAGDNLVGLLSERDYVRKVKLKGHSSTDLKVEEIMSSPVVTVTPKTTVDECMRCMTNKRCRHLPVVDEGKVVGVRVDWRPRQLDHDGSGRHDPSARGLHLRQVPRVDPMGTLAGQTAFYYLAAASIASAMLAVTRSNPIHSMLWVLALFLHVAGIFVLVGAQFLAAVQVIVYAGAILVFYLFFLMLLDLPSETAGRRFGAHWPLAAAAGAAFAFVLARWHEPGLATPAPAGDR